MRTGVFKIRDESGREVGYAKLHLRVEPDGSGVLVVNANHLLYLNRTAVEHIKLILEGRSVDEAAREISRRFRVSRRRAKREHERILLALEALIRGREVCPFSYLGVKPIDPFTKEPKAPYRVDLALTYRCNNMCIHCYSSSPREKPELTTEEWRRVLEKLADLEVPQLVFTGGEPTLREDLVELVEYAQGLGFVTGLITNGRLLSKLAEPLAKAGLDFTQVTVESHRPEVHDSITRVEGSWSETIAGVKASLEAGIYTTTNTTLMKLNHLEVEELVEFLTGLGVKAIGFNSIIHAGRGALAPVALSISEVGEALDKAKHKAHELGVPVVWYKPTRYCDLNPVEMGLGVRACSAARITLCIEPDGTAIPCQSWFKPLGNILEDSWESIWDSEEAKWIRRAGWLPEECKGCEWAKVCRGGCPLDPLEKKPGCGECYP